MHPDMILNRAHEIGKSLFGTLAWKGRPFAITVENHWQENTPFMSCIPAGDYKCLRCRKSPDYGFANSPKYGDTFQVMNVKDRTFIVFHWGNTHSNTDGCIIVANEFGILNGVPAVLNSKNLAGKGFNAFLEVTKDVDEFDLRIVDSTRIH